MNTLDLRIERHAELADGVAPALVIAVRAHGELVADPAAIAVGLDALEASATEGGEWHIFTCWCEDAGCAGIEEEVQVEHAAGLVRWRMPDLMTSRRRRRRRYIFDRDQYRSVVASVTEEFARLRAEQLPLLCDACDPRS
ncbi:MAG: hypothetical protein U0531_09000 [Dehalococcoidia bacterium]